MKIFKESEAEIQGLGHELTDRETEIPLMALSDFPTCSWLQAVFISCHSSVAAPSMNPRTRTRAELLKHSLIDVFCAIFLTKQSALTSNSKTKDQSINAEKLQLGLDVIGPNSNKLFVNKSSTVKIHGMNAASTCS